MTMNNWMIRWLERKLTKVFRYVISSYVYHYWIAFGEERAWMCGEDIAYHKQWPEGPMFADKHTIIPHFCRWLKRKGILRGDEGAEWVTHYIILDWRLWR